MPTATVSAVHARRVLIYRGDAQWADAKQTADNCEPDLDKIDLLRQLWVLKMWSGALTDSDLIALARYRQQAAGI